MTRQLQVSVWHLGTLTRRVFLGQVIIPLATWDFRDSATQSFHWFPLQAKVMSGMGLNTPLPPGELKSLFTGTQEEHAYLGSPRPRTTACTPGCGLDGHSQGRRGSSRALPGGGGRGSHLLQCVQVPE